MALLRTAADETALAELAAARLVELITAAIERKNAAVLSLTGGGTPKRLYELLAGPPWRDRVAWDRVHLYWGDERCVPPDHADSNFGMARDALVAHVPLPPSQVHRMRGELEPAEAAREYERALPQRFDVMLLGLGEDAHIASIFPGSPVLHERTARVAAPWAPHLQAFRITLTPPALLASDRIVMLVAGSSKADAVSAAIEGGYDPERWPAQLLRQADDRLEWLIDRAAARALSAPPA